MMFDIVAIPINTGALFEQLARTSCGAEVTFVGRVRESNLGRKVVGITYDIFEPLARNVFKQIQQEAVERFKVESSILVHRVGYLAVGEASIAIGVATPHRSEAFEACRYIIEQVKHTAPIWKKEHYIDGESGWVEGCVLCRS